MPQTRTQTCTDQHAEHIIIAFGESSKRMHKAAAAADDRVDPRQLATPGGMPASARQAEKGSAALADPASLPHIGLFCQIPGQVKS